MQRFSDCRVCGKRKTNEDMLVHELECAQESYEDLNEQSSPDGNDNPPNADQAGRSRNQQPIREDEKASDSNDNTDGTTGRVSSPKDQQLENDRTITEDNDNFANLEPDRSLKTYDTSEQPRFRNCKVCGVRKNNEAMLVHEPDCLQAVQDELNMQSNNSENLEPDRSSRPTRLPDKISGPPDEDEVSNDDFSTSSLSSAIATPQMSEIDENEDQEPEGSISDESSSATSMEQISDSSNDEDEEDEESKTQSTKDNPSSGKRKTKKKKNLVTETFRYDRKKPKNLFPPTKKYHYYPVQCDYCQERMPPNELRAHHKEKHYTEPENVKARRRRAQSTATRKGFDPDESDATGSKSTGAVKGPRFQFCYICGQMYGSKSIKIHEPQCLKKWRIRNDQLPPEQRAPEPKKPKPIVSASEAVAGKEEYNIPKYDPAVEAAFDRHLSSLIPCKHCSRTFSPDRIQYHTSCCIERPRSRTRDCKTPKGGEIPR